MAKDRDFLQRLEALNGGPLQNLPDAEKVRKDLRRVRKKPTDPGRPTARHAAPSTEEASDLDPPPPSASLERADSGSSPRSAITYRRDLPRTESRAAPAGPVGEAISLADAVPGVEVMRDRWGRALLVRRQADPLDGGRAANIRLPRAFAKDTSGTLAHLAGYCGGDRLGVEDVIFLDLETCGLSNAPLFLGGLMFWHEGALVIHQYLARDYSEEAAVTACLVDHLLRKKLLVSFNGKTFDLPFVRTRAAYHGVRFPAEPSHFDLLHAARRVWKRGLPDCRLQTLEKRICGRYREGDIEGRDVPDAYHAFVRTGNACQLRQILHHNALDLITLAELLARLPSPPGKM